MSENFPTRKNLRLKNYDYSQHGAYLVTICTQFRQCLFGEVVDGRMLLNGLGKMVKKIWDEIPIYYFGVILGPFVVMPNHVHGIVVFVGATPRGCPSRVEQQRDDGKPRGNGRPQGHGQPRGVAPTEKQLTLGGLMNRYKSLTTHLYMVNVKNGKWPPFKNRLWQRNYHEHIIRDECEYDRICEYIINNPLQWALDMENSNK